MDKKEAKAHLNTFLIAAAFYFLLPAVIVWVGRLLDVRSFNQAEVSFIEIYFVVSIAWALFGTMTAFLFYIVVVKTIMALVILFRTEQD